VTVTEAAIAAWPGPAWAIAGLVAFLGRDVLAA
jgi:hypothetical protein